MTSQLIQVMVERPIKKSERAAQSSDDGQGDREQRSDSRPQRGGKGRRDKRGKGRGREEEKKPAVPPALMRGPKPQPKVEPPPVEDEAPPEEAAAAETDEAGESEAPAEATPEESSES